MLKAEKFNTEERTDLVAQAGAKFFCMMGVHHDSFCLWDSDLTEWDSIEKGPKPDLVGEIERAIRGKGLKFDVSIHSVWNWQFFQFNRVNKQDVVDPRFRDLQGNSYAGQSSARDKDRWLARTKELCDKHRPDLYYFDWGMNRPFLESRRMEFLAHYYNRAGKKRWIGVRRGAEMGAT